MPDWQDHQRIVQRYGFKLTTSTLLLPIISEMAVRLGAEPTEDAILALLYRECGIGPKQARAAKLNEVAGWLRELVAAKATPAATPEKGEGDAAPAEQPKPRRGRKPDCDLNQDKRIFDAWHTDRYPTYQDLAEELRLEKRDVKRALDRERKRRKPPE